MRSVLGAARLSSAGILLALGLVLAAESCTPWRNGAEPVVSSLVVRNRGFFDVNVYAMPSIGAPATRLGTVVGESTQTFALYARHLQPGDLLVVRVRAIGANSIWTSPSVPIGEGMLAVLDVYTDASGDCSTSNLHTAVVPDSVPPPPH
jgi:hypothetical protein